jgi:hypothetical protein
VSQLQDIEDALAEVIADSVDSYEWHPRDAARAIMAQLQDIGLAIADNVSISTQEEV